MVGMFGRCPIDGNALEGQRRSSEATDCRVQRACGCDRGRPGSVSDGIFLLPHGASGKGICRHRNQAVPWRLSLLSYRSWIIRGCVLQLTGEEEAKSVASAVSDARLRALARRWLSHVRRKKQSTERGGELVKDEDQSQRIIKAWVCAATASGSVSSGSCGASFVR